MKISKKILIIAIAPTLLFNMFVINGAAIGYEGNESVPGGLHRINLPVKPKPDQHTKITQIKRQPVKKVVQQKQARTKKHLNPDQQGKGKKVGGMPAVMYPNGACQSDDNCIITAGYTCDLTQPMTVDDVTYPGTCNRPWERKPTQTQEQDLHDDWDYEQKLNIEPIGGALPYLRSVSNKQQSITAQTPCKSDSDCPSAGKRCPGCPEAVCCAGQCITHAGGTMLPESCFMEPEPVTDTATIVA